jgi:hypothetical protein
MKSRAFQIKKARVKLPTGLSSRSSFAEMDLPALAAIPVARLGAKRDVGESSGQGLDERADY